MRSHAQANAPIRFDIGFATLNTRLHGERAFDRLDGAFEFEQHSVALKLYYPPFAGWQLLMSNGGDEGSPPLDRAFLILLD